MNVLELLSNELKGKDWSIEEKSYYIYIRSCQLFSYDPRYDFYELFVDGKKIVNKIRNKKIDLENVLDNQVICTSYSKEVLSKLLRELLDRNPIEMGKGHSWILFNDDKRDIEADATRSLDLARVKMGLTTYGYNSVTKDQNFDNNLKQISKKINYIQDEYTNYFLEEKLNKIFKDFTNYLSSDEVSYDSDDFLIYKLYTIKEIFEGFNQFQNFSDAEFCISYLLRKFLKGDLRKKGKTSLFQILDSEHWNFINLYPFKLENDTIYFMLEKIDDSFCFYEITNADAVSYVNSMDGFNKQLVLRK